MGLDLIPASLHQKYRFDEREHACAILARDFPEEFSDVLACLAAFCLKRSAILTPGGGRSPISAAIDKFLWERGWREKSFNIDITIDGTPIPIPTRRIDNFKNRVGLEVEWNKKTEFYDRDSAVVICHARAGLRPLDLAEISDQNKGVCKGMADGGSCSCGYRPRGGLPRPARLPVPVSAFPA